MISRINRLVFSDQELKKLILLVLHSFFSAIFVSIFFSVANAEFVNNFGSDFLPVGYLLSGIVGYITMFTKAMEIFAIIIASYLGVQAVVDFKYNSNSQSKISSESIKEEIVEDLTKNTKEDDYTLK